MNYIIYCRRSSESAERQVLSIDAQERELRELATKNNLKVVKVFKESMSAKDEGRPVFAEMIKFVKSGKAQGILAWKLDRLARNFIDAGLVMDMLGKKVIGEIRTNERIYLPSDNVLMPSVEFGMANQYVRDLSVNVKRGNREKLSRGEWPNHAPFGYLNHKATKTIIVDKVSRKYIVRAFELYASGNHSFKEVSDILYREGLRSSSGKKVFKSLIHRMIFNPFYTGIMEREGKYYKGKHEPIISKELFDKARQVSEDECRPRKQKLFFPLRGYIRCDNCGCMFTATKKKGHDYYYCTNGRQKCEEHKTYIREATLYPLIGRILETLHFDEELVEIMYEAARERASTNLGYTTDITEGIQNSLESLKTKEARLLDSYLAEQIGQPLYEAKITEIGNERVALEQQLARVQLGTGTPESTLEPIKKVFLEASRATKEFLESDDFEKGEKLKNILWNLSFKNGNIVSYQFKKEFEVIAKSPKTGDFATLLCLLNKIRTFFQQNPDSEF
jgi:DNA invertase Pin-like site-specific DNA recombinase